MHISNLIEAGPACAVEQYRKRIHEGDMLYYPQPVWTGKKYVTRWRKTRVARVFPFLVLLEKLPGLPMPTVTYVDMMTEPRILGGGKAGKEMWTDD